jgi:hypothetical protein
MPSGRCSSELSLYCQPGARVEEVEMTLVELDPAAVADRG